MMPSVRVHPESPPQLAVADPIPAGTAASGIAANLLVAVGVVAADADHLGPGVDEILVMVAERRRPPECTRGCRPFG